MIDWFLGIVAKEGQHRDMFNLRQRLGWWRAEIGGLHITKVTVATVRELRAKLLGEETHRGTPRSGATVNRYVFALSAAITQAIDSDQFEVENPCLKLKKLREPGGRVRYLEKEKEDGSTHDTSQECTTADEKSEFQRVALACRKSRNRRLYYLFLLSVITGLRKSNAVQLTVDQVDLKRQEIRIPGDAVKNREDIVIHLSDDAWKIIVALYEMRRPDSIYLFPSKKGGCPMCFRTAWEAALLRAGVDDFRWHDLRHTAASYLAMEGGSLREIADLLSHKSLAMVQRYSHLSQSHRRRMTGVVAGVVNKSISELDAKLGQGGVAADSGQEDVR